MFVCYSGRKIPGSPIFFPLLHVPGLCTRSQGGSAGLLQVCSSPAQPSADWAASSCSSSNNSDDFFFFQSSAFCVQPSTKTEALLWTFTQQTDKRARRPWMQIMRWFQEPHEEKRTLYSPKSNLKAGGTDHTKAVSSFQMEMFVSCVSLQEWEVHRCNDVGAARSF